MTARSKFLAFIAAVLGSAAAIVVIYGLSNAHPASTPEKREIREALFSELRPVKLSNCELQRFGEPDDGGYVLCGNLLASIEAGYSYGISGYDGWGCDVSRGLKVKVHQYDSFDLRQPSCPRGSTAFHGECVAGTPGVQGGRVFDTIASQVAKNGDGAKHLVMKMDVEGAEWDSLWATPDAVLQQIDQLAIEFHENDDRKFLDVVKRLKQFFYVAHIHFNNYSCGASFEPFPSWAYEVLLVSKRLGIIDPTGHADGRHPPDAPNAPWSRDCQAPLQ